jgi:hypothetical protein
VWAAELGVPRLSFGCLGLDGELSEQVSAGYVPFQMVVVFLRGLAVRKPTKKGPKFQGLVSVRIFFDGKGDAEDALALATERGEAFAETAGAGEEVYDWNRHRGEHSRDVGKFSSKNGLRN